jgi:hypothetical protein
MYRRGRLVFEEIRAEPGRLGEARAMKKLSRAEFAGVWLKDISKEQF